MKNRVTLSFDTVDSAMGDLYLAISTSLPASSHQRDQLQQLKDIQAQLDDLRDQISAGSE